MNAYTVRNAQQVAAHSEGGFFLACTLDVCFSLQMLLYSALSNIYSKDKEPYPTAKSAGAAPSSCKSVKASEKRARKSVNERSAGSTNV